MHKIAIIAVAYNRPHSLQRLLHSLEQAVYPVPVTLIISIDKSDTPDVECFAKDYRWPHGELRLAMHEANLGLRRHMLSLGSYFSEFDALIVLEDDVTVVSSFFLFAQACVEKYYADAHIAGISLYSFPYDYQRHLPFAPAKSAYDVYLMNCAQSWGEVWMKPQWQQFIQWYDTHSAPFSSDHLPPAINAWPASSWLKYHTRYCIEEEKYFVYPYYALSTNHADPGTHSRHQPDALFQSQLLALPQESFQLPSFSQAAIRYDGFFQPKFLGAYLGIADADLCVDLFSEKPSVLYRRYLLSNRPLPFKVERAFALRLRPIEMNIICQQEGTGLWLYDTATPSEPPQSPDRYHAFSYFFGKAFYKLRTMVGLPRVTSLFFQQVRQKINNHLSS